MIEIAVGKIFNLQARPSRDSTSKEINETFLQLISQDCDGVVWASIIVANGFVTKNF